MLHQRYSNIHNISNVTDFFNKLADLLVGSGLQAVARVGLGSWKHVSAEDVQVIQPSVELAQVVLLQ